jgi:hypothetical protein
MHFGLFGDRLWPTAPTGGDRFVILPKVGSARNADVNSLYYRFRAQSGNGARSSKPVTKWKSRPIPGLGVCPLPRSERATMKSPDSDVERSKRRSPSGMLETRLA